MQAPSQDIVNMYYVDGKIEELCTALHTNLWEKSKAKCISPGLSTDLLVPCHGLIWSLMRLLLLLLL